MKDYGIILNMVDILKKIRFNDCICQSKLIDHSEVRDKILYEIDNSVGDEDNDLYSPHISKLDWTKSSNFERPWVKIIYPKFFSTLKDMVNSMGYMGVSLANMWYQQYLEGDTHEWHIHGHHFTGVYYLEYPRGCSETEFCAPFDLKYKKINAVEGDLIVFPAHCIHRGLPNGKLRKTIISFNFDAIADPVDGKSALDIDLIENSNLKKNKNVSFIRGGYVGK